MEFKTVRSGIPYLDKIVQGLRLGDNVVFQIDNLEDYFYFVNPLVKQANEEGRTCVYLRFAPHPPVLNSNASVTVITLDPKQGFDLFCSEVHRIIEEHGRETYYIFDNLSVLVSEWATDELLANFFQVTCPFLFELDTVTYFALTRGKHAHRAVARIRDTTQLLIDVYHVKGKMYIHPLKVWDRYSPQMFLPHLILEESSEPVFHSGTAAEVSGSAQKHLFHTETASIAPWDSVYKKLHQYQELGIDIPETASEIAELKKELSRMLIGSHPEFNKLAYYYFTVKDLLDIRSRLIGSGRIGGKAAGMLLARCILLKHDNGMNFSEVMEDHDSFFIGSDVFFTFLVNNDLFRLRLQLSRNSRMSHEEFEELEERFLSGKFPPEVLEQFRNMLDYFGQAPIIVRSSSLLEDSFGNAFAGKYRSEFCANQGSPEDRLESFLRAVKLVYASALNPDALSYRRRRGLGETDEQMAILVQRVAGMRYKNFFFPGLAGVAFSHNLYVWTDRIDPKKGIIRLVFGLGTRAVNRVGGDYPRMIAISHPHLRPEIGKNIAKYSQWEVDLLDLRTNKFATVSISDVLADYEYPNLHLLASIMKDGYPYDSKMRYIQDSGQELVLTFNNLIKCTNFVRIVGEIISSLADAYNHPVDVEFTASLDEEERVKINVLQCRPMWLPGSKESAAIPDNIPQEHILFKSNRIINGGIIFDIRYIIYIDPQRYSGIKAIDVKKSLGRIVGRINEYPDIARNKIIMMGPGRWGSSNINLGVNVTYADIDNTAVLVEIAREEEGCTPEISYGTHFFQDLVEAQIIYLPVYPGDPGTQFNSEFFRKSPNSLINLIPDSYEFEHYINVIDVLSATNGHYASVIADSQNQKALCFLK